MSVQIAQALAHFLWQGLAIAAILFVLLQLLRDANARYNACASALALMCAAPVATFFYIVPQTAVVSGTPGLTLGTALPASGAPVVNWFEANATRLFWLWLAGAMFLLARAGYAWWRARRLVTSGFEPLNTGLESSARRLAQQIGATGVQFRVSARVASALVFGWLKPIVVLPAAALGRLSGAEIEALLAHELAHVVRCDFLVNLLQTVAECVLFYHPLVWWVSARMREERELCCDDFAVAVCRDEVLYSKALLRLEELRMEPALAATGGRLRLRIRRLLVGPESSRLAVAPALAFVLIFGVSVALLAQDAPPAPPEPPSAVEPVEAPLPPPVPESSAQVGAVTVYRAGKDVSTPVPIDKPEPEYSPEALEAKLEGTVILSIVITPEGAPSEIKVVQPLGKGLDEKAVESLRKWRFVPGRKNGKPVSVMATVEITFRLLDRVPEAPVAPLPPRPPLAALDAVPPAPLAPVAPLGKLSGVPVPPIPPEPPLHGVIGGITGGVHGGVGDGFREETRAAAEGERAALEAERAHVAAERKAAAEEKAAAGRARQQVEAEMLAAMDEAKLKSAADPEAQRTTQALKRKLEAAARLEADKARAEADKARQESRIAAREVEIAQSELQRTEREEQMARAQADRAKPQSDFTYAAKGQANASELKRRKTYAAEHFGGENTDRGMTYVRFGPPDEIDSSKNGGTETDIWRYRDAAKTHFRYEVEFRDGKQVRSSGRDASSSSSKSATTNGRTVVK